MFNANLADRDAYLLELCRYVECNPVAAGVGAAAGDWPWSSYRAHVGKAATPPWLDSDGLHAYLLGRTVAAAQDREQATERYAAPVADVHPDEAPPWQAGLRGHVFLGDEAFVVRMRALTKPVRRSAVEVPIAKRKSPRSMQDCLKQSHGQQSAKAQLRMRRRVDGHCGIGAVPAARQTVVCRGRL